MSERDSFAEFLKSYMASRGNTEITNILLIIFVSAIKSMDRFSPNKTKFVNKFKA